MKTQRTLVLCLGLACLLLLPGLSRAEEKYTYAPDPGRETYFGHISYSEIAEDALDPLVYRPGQASPEKAVLNLPLAPGDVIQTSPERRCEIQFDSGTLIRLDYNTRIKIETILAQSLSSKMKLSNIILEQGKIYVMYKRYNRPEIFQVITDQAAFKLEHNSVTTIKAGPELPSDVWVDQGKVYILYGPDEDIDDHKLTKSQQMRITRGKALTVLEEAREGHFQQWNQKMNEDFTATHRYQTMLPKPIQRYSKAVTYFAQKYSMVYGEWHYHDLLGYVWQPHMNNYYPSSPWRPMVFGYWSEVSSQLFWVPDEPWGWVPYHLGVWHWDKQKGWLWIPGSAFAPAWVQWNFFFGGSLFAWHPLSIYHWFPRNLRGAFAYEHIDQEMRAEYNYYAQLGGYNAPPSISTASPVPKYPLPDNLKSTFKKVQKAIKNQDPELMESIRTTPSTLNVVRRGDLNSLQIRDKLIEPGQIPAFEKNGRGIFRDTDNAARAAAKTHWVNRLQDQVSERIEATSRYRSIQVTFDSLQPDELDTYLFEGRRSFEKLDQGVGRPQTPSRMPTPAIKAPVRTAMRNLDWNPDVRLGRRVGVTDIRYVSHENRVESRQLASRTAPRSAQRAFSRRSGGFANSGGGGSFSSGSGGGSSSGGSNSSGSGSSGGSGRSVSSGTGSSSGRRSGSGKQSGDSDGGSSSGSGSGGSRSSSSAGSGSSVSSGTGSSSGSGSSSSSSGSSRTASTTEKKIK